MRHLRRGGAYVRVADPSWNSPLDARYSRRLGGRWNAPGSFDVVYLNRSVDVARAQVRHKLEPRGIRPEDLSPERGPALRAYGGARRHLRRCRERCRPEIAWAAGQLSARRCRPRSAARGVPANRPGGSRRRRARHRVPIGGRATVPGRGACLLPRRQTDCVASPAMDRVVLARRCGRWRPSLGADTAPLRPVPERTGAAAWGLRRGRGRDATLGRNRRRLSPPVNRDVRDLDSRCPASRFPRPRRDRIAPCCSIGAASTTPIAEVRILAVFVCNDARHERAATGEVERRFGGRLRRPATACRWGAADRSGAAGRAAQGGRAEENMLSLVRRSGRESSRTGGRSTRATATAR